MNDTLKIMLARLDSGTLSALDVEGRVRCVCGVKYWYNVVTTTMYTETLPDGRRVPMTSRKNIVRCIDCGTEVDAMNLISAFGMVPA